MSFLALFSVSSWYLADDVIRNLEGLTLAADLVVLDDLVDNLDVGEPLALGLANKLGITT